MLYKSRAIVLKSIRYKEADVIVKLFTLEHGILSFHLKGILKSKKSTLRSALFLPFSILTIDYNYKESKSLQYIKEVKQDHHLSSLHFQISKNAIVSFLTEILNDILPEKEKDNQLFFFLREFIVQLDTEDKVSLYTLYFLTELTSYLGCPPSKENDEFLYFDLQNACFSYSSIHKEFTISDEELFLFKQLLGMNFDNISSTKTLKSTRQNLLYQLIKYYHFHVNGFRSPKSLSILETVFS